MTRRTVDASNALRSYELRGHVGEHLCVAWSPCSQYVATGAYGDCTARVWRLDDLSDTSKTGECLQMLNGHADSVKSMAWSPCSQYLATSSYKTAYVWRVSNSTCLQMLEGHDNWINSVVWSPCGQYVLTGSNDDAARVWRVSDGRCLKVIEGHTSWVKSVSWSPCGNYVLSASHDNTARIWHVSDSECIRVLSKYTHDVPSAVSPCGSMLVTNPNRFVPARVCCALTGVSLKVLEVHTDNGTGMAWSPCSTRVATGSSDGTACITTVCKWTPHTHCAFTPAARLLVRRTMCARDRLHGRACVPPLEIWLLIFEIVFGN